MPLVIRDVLDAFSDLHMPDPMPLLVTLGSIAGSRFKGFPVHLFLIGPGSSGKNEIMEACFELPHTHHITSFTEASMLSGTSKKDRAKDATGGYLEVIKQGGNEGIFIMTEFNTILTLSPERKMAALGALQNVCTGLVDKGSGSDGGGNLHWKGKVQVIGGCTENIEEARSVLNKIGERFIYCRLPEVDRKGQLLAAARNSRNGQQEIAAQRRLRAVTDFMGGLVLPYAPGSLLDADDEDVVAAAADLMTSARSPVTRDTDRSREVIQIYEAEAPARAFLELQRLLCGLRVIGVSKEDSLRYVSRVALGSIPKLRRMIIEVFAKNAGYVTVSQIKEQVTGWGDSTIRRALEDLAIHNILERYNGHENFWAFTSTANDNWYIGFGGIA
jgi:hypothetical protein